MAVSGARVTLVADHGPSKSFELPSGEERRIRLGRAKENDVQIDQKGTSWFHCELRLLEPERRGSSGALVKLRDTSTNGVGLKVPGSSTVRLTKGTDHPVPDGTTIIVPFKVKAEDGKSQDELRSSVKVSVSLIGDAVGAAPEVVELVPPLLPQAPAKPATLRETEAEPKPKVAAPTLPKAAAPKSSSGARAKAPAKAPAPPKAASAKSQSRPQARDAPELLRAWEEAPQRAKAVVEEDFPPAIPAPSGPPPGAWDPPAKEKPKPKEERTRRPDGEKDRRSRSRRRLRRDRSRERRRSKGRSERRRPDSSREAAKSPEGAAAPKATSPPPQPQPAEAPVSTVDKVPEDDTVKRFEEMMKRVKAFALEKEATYEDRVAEAKAHEEAEKRKREEEEEKEKEEAKRKEEEMKKEEEELEAKRRKEESAESAESKESAKEAPSERRASGAPTSSNMQNQTMQMMNNMNMMMANMMGMGGMMPGMGVGMPQMHMPNTQAVPKGANLQGFVAVKSGHPPPPSGVGGAELSRDGIGAVTKSKSAGAPPPLTAPSPAMSSQGWSETFSGKAQPPPPPPPSRCDRSRESGFDRGPRHEGGGFERADEGGSRHDRGGDDRDARGEARPRRGFTDAPEGARGDTNGGDPRDSKGHDRGGGGRSGRGRSSLADWQEKDIEDLCDRFQLDSYLQGKLLEALGKRSETFTQDLSSLKQTLESARNPPGLLKVKLREMEDGTFVAKGEKGKGKGFGGKGKDGGKDGKDGGKGGKGPVMSAARRAELFGGDSPPPARRSRSRKRSRSRSRSRSRRSRRRSPQGGDSGAEEPRKRLPRGSNFS